MQAAGRLSPEGCCLRATSLRRVDPRLRQGRDRIRRACHRRLRSRGQAPRHAVNLCVGMSSGGHAAAHRVASTPDATDSAANGGLARCLTRPEPLDDSRGQRRPQPAFFARNPKRPLFGLVCTHGFKEVCTHGFEGGVHPRYAGEEPGTDCHRNI